MKARGKQFVICLKNKGHEVSLERRKVYPVLPDARAAKHGLIRVVDESGEDYLYPESFFAPIKLPQPIRRAVLAAVYPAIFGLRPKLKTDSIVLADRCARSRISGIVSELCEL
jgi:hypothetical protein